MSEELYFSDELRKCLNSAGLSDCGENDAWNYWYQRVRKAHDQAVDKVMEVQRAENAKLRELLLEAYNTARGLALNDPLADVSWLADRIRELGVEVR